MHSELVQWSAQAIAFWHAGLDSHATYSLQQSCARQSPQGSPVDGHVAGSPHRPLGRQR